jgi:uncharacterized protein (TIGR02246 family)
MLRGVAVAAILMVASACTPAPETTSDVRAEVAALVQRWSDASEAGDVESLADTYADQAGFAWIERGAVSYANHAAIVEGLDRVMDASASITNDVSDIGVTPLGDGAAAFHAHYAFEVAGDAFQFSSRGTMSGVAIKQGETWRFLQGSFSELPASPALNE